MATPRHARVLAARHPFAESQVLEAELLEGRLGFIGGQYVIIDSGRLLPNGKAAKRAYSILSPDAQQERISLAALRIPGGLGSDFLNGLQVGDTFSFSGPWGKLRPPEAPSRALVLATDTGVTAALGLVRGEGFAPTLPETDFWWLHERDLAFVEPAWVEAHLPARLGSRRLAPLPKDPDPERVAIAVRVVRELCAHGPYSRAYLCGDGAVNRAVTDALVAAGVPAEGIACETFFNGVKRIV
ncbi:MAG TPA: FAD-dependent oxidoreductase [Myxococcota bacterium]|nr:FAD-dependent oxidoreductase [Myxococcota bacterium]